jgi:3-hydroxymyristoyl/3-hydroxydecanoyl-(acyl carrier protein) dehydratase
VSRYRFLDRVLAFDPGPPAALATEKTFAADEDWFSGPTPDSVPVSLLLETLATAGGYLVLRALGWDRVPLLLKVEEARVEGRVAPGETVEARVRLAGAGADEGLAVVAQAEGEVTVGGRRVLSGRVLYACVRVPGLSPLELVSALS